MQNHRKLVQSHEISLKKIYSWLREKKLTLSEVILKKKLILLNKKLFRDLMKSLN